MPARVHPRGPPDLVRTHAREYRPIRRPLLVNLPKAQCLAVSGKGPPGGCEFPEDLRALGGTAYALKLLERQRGHDFRVPILEGIDRPAEGSRWPLPAHRPMRWRLLSSYEYPKRSGGTMGPRRDGVVGLGVATNPPPCAFRPRERDGASRCGTSARMTRSRARSRGCKRRRRRKGFASWGRITRSTSPTPIGSRTPGGAR